MRSTRARHGNRRSATAGVLAAGMCAAVLGAAGPASADGGPPAEPDPAAADGFITPDDSAGGDAVHREAGRYIVSFVAGVTGADVADARERAADAGATILFDYGTALTGFAAFLTEAAVADLQANPNVRAVEPDEVVSVDSTQIQREVIRALDRIDQRGSAQDGEFRYRATGEGVTAYVIDTGIFATHDEFRGRVAKGADFVNGGDGWRDCNGHGTHVAGSLGGNTYGVAKDVTIVPVRVFGCDGTGSVAALIAGVDWAAQQYAKLDGPAVVNISAGVSKHADLDRAVAGSIAAGLTHVVAAGNAGDSACQQSPGRVPAAITVGATTWSDSRAYFSNYGKCLDIFAPGEDVISANIGSDSAKVDKSGTSMAAPLVAGAIATYLEGVPDATPSAVRTVLIGESTKNQLTGVGSTSPNRMLYSLLPTGTRKPGVSTPTVALPAEDRRIGADTIPLRVRWSGSDPDGDRITAYRLQRSYNNGKSWTTVRLSRPTSTAATVDTRPDSNLRFRVRATDARGADSANVKTPALDLDLDQQGKGETRGRWNTDRDRAHSGRSVLRSGRKGARIEFAFTGRSVRWIGTTGRDHGKAKVYIDGRYRGTVDAYSRSAESRQVLFAASTGSGRHTMTIVLTGKQRSKATSDAIGVDAIVILD